MEKINIAIDGPSGSGKGVTAVCLAKKLNYNYLDTGAMYRAIGLYMRDNNISLDNFDGKMFNKIKINFNENNEILLNGENIESRIRTYEISVLASNFSKLKLVRSFLVENQKEIVKNKGYIADGRDIGSIVIPDAEIKIYLVADVDERARRRLNDYLLKGEIFTFEEVKNQLIERDFQDMNRDESPLIRQNDAIEVDTSNLNIEEQVDIIYNIIINFKK